MARLSHTDLYKIKKTILKEFYGDSEEKFNKRKSEIAEKNREYVMAPLQQWLSKIPNNLLSRNPTYELYVNYNTDQPDKSKSLKEVWEFKSQLMSTINPAQEIYRRTLPVGNIVPELRLEVANLCEDILKIHKEKKELSEFLDTTTEQYRGSLQLRKIWPATLHKYLPAESSKTTKARLVAASAPTFIHQRLATNLLEKP